MSPTPTATLPATVRVLLADDVVDVRRLLALGLTRTQRYEVIAEAADGEQALELAAALVPDVIVLDVAMPKLDGFEVLHRLRAVAPDCRVVVLSGFGAGRFQQRALQLGARAYVEKNRGLTAITQILDEICTDLHTPYGADPATAIPAPPIDGDPGEELLAYVVHELNTPIAVIRGYAETLRTHGTADPAVTRTALDAIIRNADNLRCLLEQFREARAIEVGTLQLNIQTVDLSSFVRETVADLAAAVLTHHVSVDARTAVDVTVDPVRIRQVVTNLIGNAAKYSPDGSPIELTVGRRGGSASVIVTDRGPGIPLDQREAIFAKFTRIDRSEKGTGLGLYIARGIARAHGGDLTVDDAPGGGSRFELRLPLPRPGWAARRGELVAP